ncbi:MAG: hypothetical protein RR272_03430 [Synergistaceae bacterium]
MVKKFSKVVMLALVAVVAFSCVASAMTVAPEPYTKKATQYLTSKGWEANTKKVINDMFDAFGRNNINYNPEIRPYAVFDCDNTISLTDVQEQLFIYQIENLRFAVKPADMYKIAITGVPDPNLDLGEDYGHATVAKLAKDVAAAYAKLYKKGYVAADASKQAKAADWQKTADWQEFAAKLRLMYDAIGDSTSVSVSYPWIGYFFTDMTPAEAEQLAYDSHKFYTELGQKDPKNWTKAKWVSPKGYKSITGEKSVSFRVCTGVSVEMRELIKKLDANGIDVYICSASPVTTIRGLMRAWNLEGLRDCLAMTYKLKNGKYINEYDYDFHAQTQGVGKSESVAKVLVPLYNGHGPIFGAGDSQGDFNFMTEFKDTVAGIMVNRQRKDDAGIIAAIALYQDKKGVSLKDAMAKGEIRFVLQGRQENGGFFWAQNGTQLVGKDKVGVLHSKAEGWFKMLESGTTPNELLNQCTKLTGKLKTYQGTKTR